jgi:NAD(P)-dependent dehydrogenase (short-subunit alcohol dehydrogenase family)
MIDAPDWAWDKTFDVNLKGCFWPAREVARRLIAAKQGGSLINVSSVAGYLASPLQGIYATTKAALMSMTKTLAVELGSFDIRVNSIAPGLIETRLATAITSSQEASSIFTDRSAIKRVGQPDELAGIAVYLASDEASFTTGQTFVVDGGFVIG